MIWNKSSIFRLTSIKSRSLKSVGKKEEGYSLIEMIVVMALVGLMGSCFMFSSKWVEHLALRSKGEEIVAGIEYVKQAAALSGQSYNLFFIDDRVLVRKGIWDKPIYTIDLASNQKISFHHKDSPKGWQQNITFNGTIATEDAGTIKLQNVTIGEQVRITVGVATSKVRVYYEKI